MDEQRAREWRRVNMESRSVKNGWTDDEVERYMASVVAKATEQLQAQLEAAEERVRELKTSGRAFIAKVKELEPHIDGYISLQAIRSGNPNLWQHGTWASERDKLDAALGRK